MDFVQKLMKIASEECAKQNLDQPHVAYYQCSMVCGAIIEAADLLGISGVEVFGCKVKYPKETSYSEEDGQYTGHYFLKYGSTIYDFTLRQFIHDSPFPYIADDSQSEVKKIYKNIHPSLHNLYASARGSQSNIDLIDKIVERFRLER